MPSTRPHARDPDFLARRLLAATDFAAVADIASQHAFAAFACSQSTLIWRLGRPTAIGCRRCWPKAAAWSARRAR